ncbi:MAG TPA: amino acid ABC transporter permease [Actinomycetes bacterium]|nr:amino acid ABC transporter permease [Actinomycetes bacterium]
MTDSSSSHPATPGESAFERLSLVSARIPFRAKLAVVWLGIAAVLAWLFLATGFDVDWIRGHAQYIAKGLTYTLILAVCAIALACVMALIGSLCRLSRNPVLYGVSGFYTSFFRGTPLIVQLFLIYLALPQLAAGFDSARLQDLLTLSPFQAGVIGLGLNYGAYMTEIFRAGIQSVSGGQWEASEALAMTYRQRMRRVILPQAIRVIIPPTGNEFIAMMKDTALVSFLGVSLSQAEIFRRAQLAGKQDYKQLEAFLLAAAMYWALTGIFTFFQARLERRLSRGYVRTAVKASHAVETSTLTTQGH